MSHWENWMIEEQYVFIYGHRTYHILYPPTVSRVFHIFSHELRKGAIISTITHLIVRATYPDHHHHQILLFLVEPTASMKSFQALRSPPIPLTTFHDLLVLLISSSIVLCHVLFGLPLQLCPWGFQFNAVFSIAPLSLCNVCPIQFHFLLFIWFSTDFWWVILHSSSFVTLSVHFIFIIHLKAFTYKYL